MLCGVGPMCLIYNATVYRHLLFSQTLVFCIQCLKWAFKFILNCSVGLNDRIKIYTDGYPKTIGTILIFTFTHADGASFPVLSVAVTAVFVAGEGGTLDTAAHLTAMLVPPAGP